MRRSKMTNFTDLDYQYNKLLKLITKIKDRDKILLALEIAKKAHRGQKRDEGGIYFIHPVRVVNFLISELSIKDINLLIGGALHDVVEDTKITLNYIEKKFGRRVAFLIKKLTRDKERETKKEKFLKLMKESREVRLLKAVDWLDNLRSFPYRKKRNKRFYRHVREASEMYLPLAESINPYIVSEMKKVIRKLPTKK